MKQILTLLLGAATLIASGAAPVNRTKYCLVPTGAEGLKSGRFVTQSETDLAIISDQYGDSAAWEWRYVSGTATVAGHYALTNVATGGYLFAEGADGLAMVCAADVAVKWSASTDANDAVCFSAADKFLTAGPTAALTAATETSAASAFMLMPYDPSLTRAEAIEKADALLGAVAIKASAIAEMTLIYQASFTGANNLDVLLRPFDSASTADEINTLVKEMRAQALRMFESDLEFGSNWQQKSSGRYVTCINGTYTTASSPSTAGLWYAEFTDDGNSIVDNRTFYLRNNASRQYLVAPEAEGEVSGTASKKQATLWRVCSNPGGYAITVAASANNSRLLYPAANGTLGVNAGADAPEAAICLRDLKTYGYGVNSIKLIGSDSELTGVEIAVESGSTTSAEGVITVIHRVESASGSVTDTPVATIEAASLPAPEPRTINVDYYDTAGHHITGTAEVDVYTVSFESALAEPGEYIARANLGCFTRNGAFSEELATIADVNYSGLWQLAITPAAGTVESVTAITINGPAGVYANIKGEPDAAIEIRLQGESIASFPIADFAEGGKYDTYDFEAAEPVWFTIPCSLTDEGTYSLLVPQGFFVDDNHTPCEAATVVWEVSGTGGIRAVSSESESTPPLFDLQGRRVDRPRRGTLYLLQGNKKFLF